MSVVLPINEDDRFRIITASAGQTVLAVNFPWQDDNDISLFKGVNGAWVALTNPAGYALTGAGLPTGGSATLTTPAAAGDQYLAVGAAVLDRLSSIVRDGRFNSKNIDDELDRNRIIQQEQARDLGRAVKVGFGQTSQEMPAPDGISLLGWSAENKLINRPGEGESAAAAEAAAGRAEGAAGYVTGIETLAVAQATSFPPVVEFLQLLGRGAYGDGGAFKAVEITEDGSPLGPGQFRTNVNLKRWENAEDVITPKMFSDITEMFAFTKAQMQIPAKNYEFNAAIAVRNNAVIRCEKGSIFIPTFEPVGAARETPLFDLGVGADINYLKMQLDAGINTIRKGFRLGSNSQVGYIEVTSADLNNNRTEPGSTDLISGAVLIEGEHIRVGQIYLSRFDRGWCVVDSTDVIIGKIRNLETLMGGYVHGTRDLHVLSAFTTGAANSETIAMPKPKGIMTPGLNSLCLAGCSDSSFGLGGGWQAYDILEHGIRVGAAIGAVPNHRIAFGAVKLFRAYGCGFKMDDGDAFNIKKVTVESLYTEDIGNGNWFGTGGYQNWSLNDGTNYINSPGVDNDGNKEACAIRNSQYVDIGSFRNQAISQAQSGYIGLWVERSNYVSCPNVQTFKSRTSGIEVQSGGTTSPEEIYIKGKTADNLGSGVKLNAAASDAVWRGVHVEVDSQNNGLYDFEVTANLSGGSSFATKASRISGFARGGASGGVSIAAPVLADPDFTDEVEMSGTWTPTLTFATPGDLSLGSVSASGTWRRRGRYVEFEGSYSAVVTHTTASGNIRFGGLPFAAADADNIVTLGSIPNFSSWNSRTMLVAQVANGQSFMEIRGFAAATGGSPIGTGNVATGSTVAISFAGRYRT